MKATVVIASPLREQNNHELLRSKALSNEIVDTLKTNTGVLRGGLGRHRNPKANKR